jgi:hypothetical protein
MPLRFVAGPENGTQLVQAGLNRLAARRSNLSSVVRDFSSLEVSRPHAVYDLRADAIASGGGLETAILSGVRYLVDDGNTTVAAAEVSLDDNGLATVLANINSGPYVEATARTLTRVAGQNAVASEPYEVRLLRFAAIYLMALWLKSDSGDADIIYPLSPAPPGLSPADAYSPQSLIEIIRPLAEERMATGRTGIP